MQCQWQFAVSIAAIVFYDFQGLYKITAYVDIFKYGNIVDFIKWKLIKDYDLALEDEENIKKYIYILFQECFDMDIREFTKTDE